MKKLIGASNDLKIALGTPVSYNTSPDHYVVGDIWATAWAADDTLFAVADDFRGWQGEFTPGGRNVSLCRIDGRPPALEGSTVNDLIEFGTEMQLDDDGACWKASGLAAVDGALYLFVSRQWYGLQHPGRREIKHSAYLLRSDDGGESWQWSHSGGARAPIAPGPGFAAPYFVEFGQDGAAPEIDNAREFVYAISSDGVWDNGDSLTLARVPRTRIADLDRADWNYYQGGDGMDDASWGSLEHAVPILSAIRRCSMTGMHYLAATGQYLVMEWHYPDLTPRGLDTSSTVWEFYTADHPWGPFTKVHQFDWPTTGLYNPYLPNKLMSEDGRSGTIFASGDFLTWNEPWQTTNYTLWSIPFDIVTE